MFEVWIVGKSVREMASHPPPSVLYTLILFYTFAIYLGLVFRNLKMGLVGSSFCVIRLSVINWWYSFNIERIKVYLRWYLRWYIHLLQILTYRHYMFLLESAESFYMLQTYKEMHFNSCSINQRLKTTVFVSVIISLKSVCHRSEEYVQRKFKTFH